MKFPIIVCLLVSAASGSYEDNHYAPHSDGRVPSASSTYHYHVPLVGQNYQVQSPLPYHHHHPQQSNNQELYYLLIPALLLLGIPFLLLSLLPLLLLPIFLSLLALLMAGMMPMAMMMMEMMEMMGPSARIRTGLNGAGKTGIVDMRSIINDLSPIFTANDFSYDQLANCDARFVCELGVKAKNLSGNSSRVLVVSESLLGYFIPFGSHKESTMKTFQNYKDAFFWGVNSNNCLKYECPLLSHKSITESSQSDSKYSGNSNSQIDIQFGLHENNEINSKTSPNEIPKFVPAKKKFSESKKSKFYSKKLYVSLLGTPTIKF